MKRHLTATEKTEIHVLASENIGINKLATRYKVSRMTIWRVVNKEDNEQSSPSSERKRLISGDIEAEVRKTIKQSPDTSLRKLAIFLQDKFKIKISHTTIKRYLNDIGIAAYSPIKKPMLKPVHIQRRYELSKKIFFTWINELKKIFFTDESKFNLIHSDGRVKVWREKGKGYEKKYLRETLKFGGGNVMVWGCFSYRGVGRIKIIDKRMTALDYIEILRDELIPSVKKQIGEETPILLHDNDPKHTARITKEFLRTQNIKVLPWPSQSPDLNPIENLWEFVKCEVQKYQPRNIAELKNTIIHVWHTVPIELCEKLALSFKKRVYECIKNNGNVLKY